MTGKSTVTTRSSDEQCPSCKGYGYCWRGRIKVLCTRCEGRGRIAPRGESWRDFRKRVIGKGNG